MKIPCGQEYRNTFVKCMKNQMTAQQPINSKSMTYPASKALCCCRTVSIVKHAEERAATWNETVIVRHHHCSLQLLKDGRLTWSTVLAPSLSSQHIPT
jgi:hypothetical protein